MVIISVFIAICSQIQRLNTTTIIQNWEEIMQSFNKTLFKNTWAGFGLQVMVYYLPL